MGTKERRRRKKAKPPIKIYLRHRYQRKTHAEESELSAITSYKCPCVHVRALIDLSTPQKARPREFSFNECQEVTFRERQVT